MSLRCAWDRVTSHKRYLVPDENANLTIALQTADSQYEQANASTEYQSHQTSPRLVQYINRRVRFHRRRLCQTIHSTTACDRTRFLYSRIYSRMCTCAAAVLEPLLWQSVPVDRKLRCRLCRNRHPSDELVRSTFVSTKTLISHSRPGSSAPPRLDE